MIEGLTELYLWYLAGLKVFYKHMEIVYALQKIEYNRLKKQYLNQVEK